MIIAAVLSVAQTWYYSPGRRRRIRGSERHLPGEEQKQVYLHGVMGVARGSTPEHSIHERCAIFTPESNAQDSLLHCFRKRMYNAIHLTHAVCSCIALEKDHRRRETQGIDRVKPQGCGCLGPYASHLTVRCRKGTAHGRYNSLTRTLTVENLGPL